MTLTQLFALLCLVFLIPVAIVLTFGLRALNRAMRNWSWRRRIMLDQRAMTEVRGRRVA